MSKRRQYRRRGGSEEEPEEASTPIGEEETVSKTLHETREAQKYRRRPAGVTAVGLAFGKKYTEEEAIAPDPFKMKTGGLIHMKDLKASELQGADDEVVQKLSANFSAETKQLDNEEHMLDYIEHEMAKRKPVTGSSDEDTSGYEQKIKALYQVPEHLLVKKKEQSEEMLSNQMLSGIPEVDLGLEARFSNIEETEQARQKQLKQTLKKPGDQPPKKNFTLHSLRFHRANKEPHRQEQKKKEEQEAAKPEFIPVVGESEPELVPTGQGTDNKRKKKIEQAQMATDDYHYDRFRKKTRMF